MLDLVEVLKDCPAGTKLYSTIHGEVTFNYVGNPNTDYPIKVSCIDGETGYSHDGRYNNRYNGECVLFPSKGQRDWSKFEISSEKFDYTNFKPFDKVLVKVGKENCFYWYPDFVSYVDKNMGGVVVMSTDEEVMVIPYNEETAHLVNTYNMPDKKYRWWED